MRRFIFGKKKRGQVFIMATLLMVVYSVSMIAVVTELAVKRHNQDEINLDNMMSEYVEEMKFQIQRGLFKYISTPAATEDTIIIDIESFHDTFSNYALQKGVQSTLVIKTDEFQINAIKNNTVPTAVNLGTNNFNSTIYISLNISVVFQSVNSASILSGTTALYYGINAFIAQTPGTILTFKEVDRYNILTKYISGITFSSPNVPTTPSDFGNGSYLFNNGYDGQDIFATLPTGIDFLS